jgi:hypothetical protein
MLASHRKKFVYVHIPKTGGSTINVAVCCNYFDFLPDVKGFTSEDVPVPRDNFCSLEIGQHATMPELVTFFTGKGISIEDYFKFSCVRNPWALVVSNFFYFKHTTKADGAWFERWRRIPNFEQFVLHHLGLLKSIPQSKMITDKAGNLMVDFVMKTETLQEDFNTVCDRLDVPHVELGNFNTSDHKHYSEYYNDTTRDVVARLFAKDIELFGYEFGD